MTEMIEDKKPPLRQHMIDPVAFFAALILGPLVFTVASFWLFLIPVGALFFGGPAYLVLGTPVLLWHLSRHAPDAGKIASCAVVTVLIAAGPAALFIVGTKPPYEPGMLVLVLVFCLIFASCWGATFAWLYTWFCRDFFTRTA